MFGPSDFNKQVTHLERAATVVAGQNTISVRLASKPGSSVTVGIRKAAFPQIAVTAPLPEQCFNYFPTVRGTTKDSCIKVKSNNKPGSVANDQFQVSSVPLVESDLADVLTVATDWCNNTASDDRKVIYDITPPLITTGGSAAVLSDGGTRQQNLPRLDGAYSNVSITPTYSITDINLVFQANQLTLTTGDPYDRFNDTTSSLSFASGQTLSDEGDYTLSLDGKDCATNESKLTQHFTIDKTPPRITIGGVTNGQIIRDASVTPTFIIADRNRNPAAESATLNGAPFTSGTRVSAAGHYLLLISATDLAGNHSESAVAFSIAICGNGIIEPGESCDPPNGACCGSTCQLAPAGTVCRTTTDHCRVNATCTGSGPACPPNGFSSDTAMCGGIDRTTTGTCPSNCTTTQITVPNAPVPQVIAQPGVELLLAKNTSITVNGVAATPPFTVSVQSSTARPASLPADAVLASPVFKLGPSGAHFSPPIELTMMVDNSVDNPLAWLCDDQGQNCQERPTTVSLDTAANQKRVKFPVDHFSVVFATYGPSGETLTQHNNNFRTGVNPHERLLNVSNVNATTFKHLASLGVDGSVYAQPLYASGIGIDRKNVLFVATMKNKVYALDTAAGTFPQLWVTDLDTLAPPGLLNPIGLPNSCIGPDFYQRNTTSNIADHVGIMSTPVLTPDKSALYLVAAFKDGGFTCDAIEHVLMKLDPATGHILDATVIRTPNGFVPTFIDHLQGQRPGLLYANNSVYVAFASYGDGGFYHGWVFRYIVTPGLLGGDPSNQFITTTNGHFGGGIWQAAQGLAADDAGNIYFMTGNSFKLGDSFDKADLGLSDNLGDSFVKLNPDLSLADSFTPVNASILNGFDADLGAAGVVLTPTASGLRVVGGGKEGKLYSLNPNNLRTGADSIFVPLVPQQDTCGGFDSCDTKHIHGSPVFWNRPSGGSLLYVWPENYPLVSYAFGGTFPKRTGSPTVFPTSSQKLGFSGGIPTAVGQTFKALCEPTPPNTTCKPPTLTSNGLPIVPFGMPGGFMTLSYDGADDNSGVLWVSHPLAADGLVGVVKGVLRAYDAVNLTELWNSEATTFNFGKFAAPTVANGHVYLPTFADIGSDFATVEVFGRGFCSGTLNCSGSFCGEGDDGCGGICTAANGCIDQCASVPCYRADSSGACVATTGNSCAGAFGVCQSGFCVVGGSYAKTCSGCSFNGSTLTCASCRTCLQKDGPSTSLSLSSCKASDISNCNGVLTCGACSPARSGVSYAQTCSDCNACNPNTLTCASCPKCDGSAGSSTSLSLFSCTSDIANCNGVLTCGTCPSGCP